MLVERKNQEEEIVFRNKGEIDGLLNHIEQEIHLNSIIRFKISDGLQKFLLELKLTQLHEIKLSLQQAIIKYKEENEK